MFCRKCGTQLSEKSRFCPKCGMSVPAPTSPPTPAAVPALEPSLPTLQPSRGESSSSHVRAKGYSKKTRILGILAIIVLISAIVVSAVGWYSIGESVLQTYVSLQSHAQNGMPGLIQNTTAGEALVLPITDAGLLPISVRVEGALLDSQNNSLYHIDSVVEVNPHQTRSLVVQIPASVNPTSVNSGSLQARVEVTTLDGLLGVRLALSLNLTSSAGTAGGQLS